MLKKGQDVYDLGYYLDILEDPTSKLTVTDINSSLWSKKFKTSLEKIPNFGVSESSFWARFTIVNEHSENLKWVLSHKYFLQDEIEFFKK